MCGLFGILNFNSNDEPDEAALARSAELLSHRGPDYTGIYSNPGIGLVHTRLSLIDLTARSNQPLWDQSGRYVIVYNGEIYNYREIRQDLESRGVVFGTTSDTEVLLYSLIMDGTGMLDKMVGMFAFGFFDTEKRVLVLGRDRFGIKPLYYSVTADSLLFSSEQKALEPWVDFQADDMMIASYLLGYGGPYGHRSYFSNINMLPAGTTLEIRGAVCSGPEPFFSLGGFWDPQYHSELENSSDNKIVDTLEELLFQSVESHMLADAKVGALCSGGVDSSLIMAMASRINRNLAIFHADVIGPNSERDAAELLARHLKLDLVAVEVADQDFIDGIPKVTRYYEQPFAYHPNSIPFLKVTELVRQNSTKAILTGEAADECYLGYSYLPTEDFVKGFQSVIGGISGLLSRLPHVSNLFVNQAVKNTSPFSGLLNGYEHELEYERIIKEIQVSSGCRPNGKEMKTIKLLGYHLRSLLHRNDSLGMAASIEARFPFLGHDVVKFAVNLPYRFKIRPSSSAYAEIRHPFLQSKWALRKVAERYLPKSLSNRVKRGFPTSAFERMRVDLGLLRDSYVSSLLRLDGNAIAHLESTAGQDLKLRLMLLDVWGRVHIQREPDEKVQSDIRKYLALG